jgi:GDSL-like lipase/acylhydrolase family protein
VHPQSWAQWVAEVLDLPFTKLAADGALAADVLREQVPRLRGPYDVGCVFAGVNDVRVPAFDPAAYERDLRAIAAAVAAASDRVVLLTVPADLGRPRAAPKPRTANAIIRRAAGEVGAVVVDLEDLAGARWLLPDAVHPTAVGQLEIGDRAARVLGAPRLPSATVEVHRSRRARGRFAARRGVLLAGDLRRRAVERMRPPSL